MSSKKSAEHILRLVSEIDEELEGVYKYAEASLADKDSTATSKTYAEMSRQELQHAQNLQKIMEGVVSDVLAKDPDSSHEVLVDFLDCMKHDIETKILKAKAAASSLGS